MALGYVTGLRNAQMDAITTFTGTTAKLQIMSGTRPATGGTATTVLAILTCNATFAPASSGGVLTLNAISSATASATGTASWFRLFKSDGTTIVMDGDVGTSGSDLNLNSTSITSGGSVSVSSFVLTCGNP
jgi:hypothetical protein